jgi:hypothetical protein
MGMAKIDGILTGKHEKMKYMKEGEDSFRVRHASLPVFMLSCLPVKKAKPRWAL